MEHEGVPKVPWGGGTRRERVIDRLTFLLPREGLVQHLGLWAGCGPLGQPEKS